MLAKTKKILNNLFSFKEVFVMIAQLEGQTFINVKLKLVFPLKTNFIYSVYKLNLNSYTLNNNKVYF